MRWKQIFSFVPLINSDHNETDRHGKLFIVPIRCKHLRNNVRYDRKMFKKNYGKCQKMMKKMQTDEIKWWNNAYWWKNRWKMPIIDQKSILKSKKCKNCQEMTKNWSTNIKTEKKIEKLTWFYDLTEDIMMFFGE